MVPEGFRAMLHFARGRLSPDLPETDLWEDSVLLIQVRASLSAYW